MKKVVTGSLVLGAVMGGLAVVQMPQHAQAATYQVKKLMGFRHPTSYYAKSAKSGYLWNKSHTKRLHNLKNYPKTTWYATAKYSMKSVRNSGTYLKVINGTGKAEGYVWTGYLKKGVNPANPNGTLTDPFGAAMSTYNVDDNLNKQLVALFPGTIPDEPLQLAADFIFANAGANPDDYTSVIEELVGAENEPSVFRLSSDKRIQKNQNFLSFQRNSLKEELVTKHKKFTSFKGYRIGAYAFPKHDKRYGESMILLLPSN